MKKKPIELTELVKHFGLEVECGEPELVRKVTGGYVGDLLSDVMANSRAGDVWITLQIHPNIVAVAVLKELSAIILVNGRKPAAETVRKAMAEKLPILSTARTAFDMAGRLFEYGVPGAH